MYRNTALVKQLLVDAELIDSDVADIIPKVWREALLLAGAKWLEAEHFGIGGVCLLRGNRASFYHRLQNG
ncbi:hypothetical protein D3C78_705570 [compost metagenome]